MSCETESSVVVLPPPVVEGLCPCCRPSFCVHCTQDRVASLVVAVIVEDRVKGRHEEVPCTGSVAVRQRMKAVTVEDRVRGRQEEILCTGSVAVRGRLDWVTPRHCAGSG